jgi:hypothetical protein
MPEKGLNRGLHFQALDWTAYSFLRLWSFFDKKLRRNLKQPLRPERDSKQK